MGCKRQRAGELSRRRLSLALTALAWVAATAAAQNVHVGDGGLRIRAGDEVVPLAGPTRLRWRRVLVERDDAVGTVHAENDGVADSENREGSNAGAPTPAPAATTTTPAPSTTAPAPTSRPPSSSSSSRGDETLPPVPAPSSTAPPPATTVPPPPPMTETTTPPPPSTTPAPTPATTPTPSTPPTTEDATTQPTPTTPAPSTPAPSTPAPATPAPSSAPPTTTPAPSSPPLAPSTPPPPPPPAPTSAPPSPPPATPPGPTQPPAPPAATTPAPTGPKATTPAPPPTTAKPTPAPPATTPAPSTATPSLTPTLTTKAPTVTLTKAPSNGSGAGANSGADDTAASDSTHDGNEKVKAPDLSSLTPIAGSGVITKSNRTPSPGSGDGSDAAAATKNKTPTSGLNNISTLGIAGIVVGVLAVVLLAILFVHVRRKRNEKDEDSARQRQLDDFFSDHRAPLPRSGHPGAASLISNSSNGMTFIAPPNSLTPRDEIPIASSARFKQAPHPGPGSRPMSPQAAAGHGGGGGAPARFDDNVLGQGRIVPKGRMYSIPASPSNADSSSGEFNASSSGDSFMGTGEQSFYDTSSRQASELSLRSSSAESRDTGLSAFSRTTSEARSTAYFPQGLSESRSTMVQMGLAKEATLPRGDAGDILIPVPRPAQDDASTTFSVSDSEYGSPAPRDGRVDSSISSSSNQNPWALLTLDDALSRSLSPPTSIDESAATGSSRGESQASALSDLPSSRSDNSYYMSDEEGDGRSTRANSEEYDVDSYAGSARGGRADSYAYTADSFTSGEGSARSARTDSYGYANSSFGDGSHLSFLSDRSTGFRPSQSGGPDVLEGNI